MEQLPYPLLVQMGHGAFAFAFELGVALPYRPLVLTVGMPDLTPMCQSGTEQPKPPTIK